MSITCGCGATVPEGSEFCPKCGKQIGQAPAANTGGVSSQISKAPSNSGMTENVAGGLSYITFVPAIIFLAIEPYNKSSFVRFHAWQCIFLTIVSVVVHVGLGVLGGFMAFVGFFVISPLVSLLFFVLWLICIIKAFQNQMFKIPVIGDLAAKQASV